MPNISDTKREEIVSKLKQDIDAANAYYEEKIEPKIIERYDIYKASKDYYRKLFPKLSKRCEITSTDVQDTIESTMPSIMKTFFGSTDVISIQGHDGTDEDNQRAEKMQELINYELDEERFFMTFYQWAKDALITNLGIVKVDWDREYKPQQQTVTMDVQAYEQFAEQAEGSKISIEKVESDPVAGGVKVTFTAPVLNKNQPRIMNVLASEFRFSPDATDLKTCDFVAHRKIVTLDYLRKQQEAGMYQHVDELAEKAKNPHYTTLDTQNNDDVDDEPNRTDSGRRKVEIYECYVNMNMSDDPNGKLQPMIVTVSNGVILRMEENTYERHPFFTLSPRIDPHKIWPDTGFVDLIAQLQHAKTAILRQMIYNIAQGNDSKMGINLGMLQDVNDVLEGAQYIRVNGNIQEALMPLPASPLQSWTFDMMEYLDNVKENRTGITKYNQGMDANSLNKTATGINIITQQANQRLELIARIFAETGLRDMFRFLIKMNQLFINQDMVIRLTNGPMQISPDDLEGRFDLEVNAGMGAGAKEQNLQNLNMLQGLMTQLYQIGMVGPNEIYNFAKKYIEEIGYKSVDDFIMTPDKAMQMQQDQPGEKETTSESLRAAITDAPWQIQMQWWQKQGFQVTPDMFTEQAQQKAMASAVDANVKADASRESIGDRIAERAAKGAAGQRGAQGANAPEGNKPVPQGNSDGSNGEYGGRPAPGMGAQLPAGTPAGYPGVVRPAQAGY